MVAPLSVGWTNISIRAAERPRSSRETEATEGSTFKAAQRAGKKRLGATAARSRFLFFLIRAGARWRLRRAVKEWNHGWMPS